jgi:hypothetical protein
MNPQSTPVAFALLVILLPATIAGVVLLAGRKLRGRPELGWVGALAFGLAYVAGHLAVLGVAPAWPPQSSNEGLLYAGAIAALGAAVAAFPRWPALGASLVLGIAHVAAMAPVVGGIVAREPSPRPVLFAVSGFLIAAMATMRFDRLASSSPGPWTPLWLWIVAASTAVANLLSGSMVYAQYSAVVAAILGAAVVVGLIARDTSFARGLAPAAFLQVLGLCVAGKLLSYLPTASFVFLAGAPWLAAFLLRSFLGRWSERKLRIACTLVIAASCAAGLAFAYAAHLERSSAYSY